MDAKLIVKLVPAELRNGYEFSRQGIVKSPGKFEGESIATLYFYDRYLNGDGVVMEISDEERRAFDIGAGYTHVYLGESEYGFVHLYFCTSEEEAESMDSESDEPEPFYDDCPTCPICDGESESLGTLGNVSYYRCTCCGMDFKE